MSECDTSSPDKMSISKGKGIWAGSGFETRLTHGWCIINACLLLLLLQPACFPLNTHIYTLTKCLKQKKDWGSVQRCRSHSDKVATGDSFGFHAQSLKWKRRSVRTDYGSNVLGEPRGGSANPRISSFKQGCYPAALDINEPTKHLISRIVAITNEGSCVPALHPDAVSACAVCLEGEETTVVSAEHQVPPCLASFSILSWKTFLSWILRRCNYWAVNSRAIV